MDGNYTIGHALDQGGGKQVRDGDYTNGHASRQGAANDGNDDVEEGVEANT